MWHKRFEESILEIDTALELDPLSAHINRNVAQIYRYAGRGSRATEAIEKTLEIDPNFAGAHGLLGLIHMDKGMFERALEEFDTELRISSGWQQPLDTITAIIHARMGDIAKAREMLERCQEQAEQTHFSPYFLAHAWNAVGDNGKALDLLWKAYEERDSNLPYISVDQTFSVDIRAHPRFIELLRKIGLPVD
jgi:tetratricopeptide (TPR) repeat protein